MAAVTDGLARPPWRMTAAALAEAVLVAVARPPWRMFADAVMVDVVEEVATAPETTTRALEAVTVLWHVAVARADCVLVADPSARATTETWAAAPL
jgi:hypothetical protein